MLTETKLLDKMQAMGLLDSSIRYEDAYWNAAGSTVMTSDTIREAVHYLPEDSPQDIAYKALAVNVSDMMAMGATPHSYFINMTLRDLSKIDAFLEGLVDASKTFGVKLCGGDTVKSACCEAFSVFMWGSCDMPLKRAAASVHDDVYVTGYLGDACIGLINRTGRFDAGQYQSFFQQAYLRPNPPLETALILAGSGMVVCATDVSDGLVANARGIAVPSGVDIVLYTDALPLSAPMCSVVPRRLALQCACCGGDDYQLLFTSASENRQRIMELSHKVPITCIGRTQEGAGGVLLHGVDAELARLLSTQSYEDISLDL